METSSTAHTTVPVDFESDPFSSIRSELKARRLNRGPWWNVFNPFRRRLRDECFIETVTGYFETWLNWEEYIESVSQWVHVVSRFRTYQCSSRADSDQVRRRHRQESKLRFECQESAVGSTARVVGARIEERLPWTQFHSHQNAECSWKNTPNVVAKIPPPLLMTRLPHTSNGNGRTSRRLLKGFAEVMRM